MLALPPYFEAPVYKLQTKDLRTLISNFLQKFPCLAYPWNDYLNPCFGFDTVKCVFASGQ